MPPSPLTAQADTILAQKAEVVLSGDAASRNQTTAVIQTKRKAADDDDEVMNDDNNTQSSEASSLSPIFPRFRASD